MTHYRCTNKMATVTSGAAFLLVLLVLTTSGVGSTSIKKCKGKLQAKNMAVDISACDKPPCILKKNTSTTININFIPENNVRTLRNRVYATIGGIPLPFIGVDGQNSCEHVYHAGGEKKAGCPLEAGKEYVYKNKIDVLPLYPTVNPLVHWALQDSNTNGNVVCFEMLSKIVQ